MADATKRESRIERLQRELEETRKTEALKASKRLAEKYEALERANKQIDRWTAIAERLSTEIDELEELASYESPSDADNLSDLGAAVLADDED